MNDHVFSIKGLLFGHTRVRINAFHPDHKLRLMLSAVFSGREARLTSCWQWRTKTIFFELGAKKMPAGASSFWSTQLGLQEAFLNVDSSHSPAKVSLWKKRLVDWQLLWV